MLRRYLTAPDLNDYITVSLVASVLLHIVILWMLFTKQSSFEAPPMVIDVVLDPTTLTPPKQKPLTRSLPNQIITEPQSKESKAAPQTNLRAEKNRFAEKEQIRRGLPDAGASIGPGAQQASSQPASKQAVQKSTERASAKPKLDQRIAPQPTGRTNKKTSSTTPNLRLDPSELVKRYQTETTPQPPSSPAASQVTPLSSYRAFSRPSGSGARFLGTPGSSDHLPHLPDGDITLLNAKASRFAVFVRRVATQVFSKLRAGGWESVSARDIQAMSQFSTVRAVLSPTGEFLSVELLGPSGSVRFDDLLKRAVQMGASDPHPPAGATAPDGNIRFIFKARSWSKVGPSRGGAGLAEQRWLLLSTGLE